MTVSTWTATSARSWRTSSPGGGSGGWRDNNEAYQGQYFSGSTRYGLHKGLWFFDDADIRATLAGETITQVRLRLTRRGYGGVTSAQTPTIRRHNYSSRPSSEPSFVGWTNTSESWAWGETDWVTLNNSWGQSFRDGNARGLGVYTGSNSPYMIFSPTAVLEITHEPTLSPPSTPPVPTIDSVSATGYTLASTEPGDVDTWEWNPQDAGTNYAVTSSPTWTRSRAGGEEAGTTERVRVRHRNGAGVSAYSAYRDVLLKPSAPTGLAATASTGEVALTWDAQTLGTGGEFQVRRDGVLVHTTTSTAWTDTGRAEETRYGYSIQAVNNAGTIGYTSTLYAVTKAPDPVASALVDVAHASTQLEDGTTVYAVVDGAGDYEVRRALLDGTTVALATVATDGATVLAMKRSGKLQSLALTSDRAGNLYLVGARGAAANRVAIQALVREGADTWTPGALTSTSTLGLELPQGFAAVWTDEGNGEGGEGRLLIALQSGEDGRLGSLVIDAYYPLRGELAVREASVSPTWLVSSSAFGSMRGTGLALATASLGSPSVAAVTATTSSTTGGSTDRVRVSTVTVGASVATVSSVNQDASFPFAKGLDYSTARVVGVAGGGFVAGWSLAGPSFAVRRVGAGSIAQLGGASAHDLEALELDYAADDEASYVYTFRAGGLVRTPYFTTTGTFGAETVLAATVTDPRGLRLPAAIADGRFLELQYATGDTTLTRLPTSHNQAPFAPTVPAVEPFDAGADKVLPWTFEDPNPSDEQSAYSLEVERTDTGATVVTTGKVTSGTEEYTVTGGALTNGIGYRFRVQTWDLEDEPSPFSEWRSFSPTAAATVAITSPPADALLITSSTLVEWTYTHPTSDPQSEWRVRLLDGATVVQTTGWTAGTAASYLLQGMESGAYTLELQVRTDGVPSNVDAQSLTIDVDTPDEPLLTVDERDGYARVSIENPAPTGDRPLIVDNQLFRRRQGVGDAWVRIAVDLGNSPNYDDYNLAGATPYEYVARAVAAEGGYKDSAEVAVTVHLEGVWLHDLTDPQGSLRQYRYSGGGRKESYEAETTLLHFAGRPFPVAEFGEHGTQSLEASVFVPYQPAPDLGLDYLRSVIDRRAMVVYRDNRGRVIFAALHSLAFEDARGGTVASFRVDRVNHEEAV